MYTVIEINELDGTKSLRSANTPQEDQVQEVNFNERSYSTG